MKAHGFAYNCNNNCCAMAAACSPARIRPILDTALVLAVSICVLILRVIVGTA